MIAECDRDKLFGAVNRDRLVGTAMKLIAIPSRTGEAGAVADCLADMLKREGFAIERPAAGHPKAPAVLVRWQTNKPGRTLQFNGHLDTVHLPFVPPKVENGRLTGSGASDMKAGTAAAVEALRVLRETGALQAGAILFTAHDLHECPWGDGGQLNQLIRDGQVGDAVLIPEYLNECIPVIGRGALIWKVAVRRPGPPVHEVMRTAEPSVIAAAARLVERLMQFERDLSTRKDPMAGPESLFIGQIHAGEIFNQYPQECRLEGTRRWLPGTRRDAVEREFRDLLADVAHETGTTVTPEIIPIRDAFWLDQKHPFVGAFQEAHAQVSGRALPIGAKPFCDDGNSFWSLAKIPTITHGPRAGGAHTLNEWVDIDDLVRVARLYALTAVTYCHQADAPAS
jgi:acetylornithine deacetylase/succinyl-diaminopimelate desuccinylase-like protein